MRDGLGAAPVRQGVLLYSAQLALNLIWSVLFFGMHAVFLGLLDILLLFVLIAATTASFLRISRPAAWLLVPYLCWVGFASLVNAMTWILNR
jgi:tryptophan-rich sensory protein